MSLTKMTQPIHTKPYLGPELHPGLRGLLRKPNLTGLVNGKEKGEFQNKAIYDIT